jgi:integrase
MGRKPSVIVKPVRIFRPLTGEIWADGYNYKVTVLRGGTNKENDSYHYDFTLHPLRELINTYLLEDVEDVTAGTINHRCTCLRLIREFMNATDVNDLSAEVMLKFVRWLNNAKTQKGGPRFADTVIAVLLNNTVRLYDVGLCKARPGWSQRDLDLILTIVNKEQLGLRHRTTQRSIEKALSVKTFTALAKAVSLEMEECRHVLREWQAGKRMSLYNLEVKHAGVIDPNPFVVFSLEAVLRYGIRAQELNTLQQEDIRIDEADGHHSLYVHAPDKEDDFIPVDQDFLETLNVCFEWSREAREIAGEAGHGLLDDALLVYPPNHEAHRERLLALSSYNLNRTQLPYFYRKWFKHMVKDQDGNERPLLHAEGDLTKPLKISFRKLRNAFAARFIEREPNRVVAQRVMRHKSFKTTEQHYLHRTVLTHARKVYIALEAEAQLLVLNLKNAIETGISEQTIKRAMEAGAITPHGICGKAMEGHACQVASDCLVCPYLVIITTRKPRFEADRDVYLGKGEKLIDVGDYRGAENMLSRAKLCQAHINRIEDMERAKSTE